MSYQDWTPQQKQALKAWIAEQDMHDTVKLRNAVLNKPSVGHNDWQELVDRDLITVKAEELLKAIAQSYGITTATTPAQINQIFLDAFTAAGTTAEKFQVLDDKHMFWITYLTLRTVDVSGADTRIINRHDSIYGQSPAEEMGLEGVTGDDIESAMRGVP